jgi:hypothetical protein
MSGKLLEGARQRNTASIRAEIKLAIVANAVARGMDIALLDRSSQAHDLAGKHRHERLRSFWFAIKLS